MKKNKIGAIFLISALALAGIGISYAGFTDTINITGTVNSGTVSWEAIEYSGTWVWKDIENHGKIVNYGEPIDYDGDGVKDDDPNNAQYDNEHYMLVSSSWAQEGSDDYDIEIYYDNIYPGTNFEADVVIEYTGSIPGRLNELILSKDDGWNDYIDEWTTVEVFDASGETISIDELPGYQLHNGDTIHVVLTINLPQENNLMLKSGHFTLEAIVVQWNEYPYDYSGECSGEADLTILKEVSEDYPYVGDEIEFYLTATNNGPDTAKNVQVVDDEPDGLTFTSASASKDPISISMGQVIWNIGDMNVGDTETATITATVGGAATFAAKTQLCMILDGSGSISSYPQGHPSYPGEWEIMIEGIAAAVNDETIFPHDGTVELTIIQFAGGISGYARVEVGPIVVDSSNYASVVSSIQSIPKSGSSTPLYAGIDLAQTTLEGSSNHPSNGGDFLRQVFNLVTDGVPNVYPVGYSSGKEAAEAYRDVLVATLNTGEDEFDAEGIGILQADIDWIRDEIVWPEPGYQAPPFDQGAGWVRDVATFTEFADTIGEKFTIVLQNVVNCATIESSEDDPNPQDNSACVTVYPQDASSKQLAGHWKLDDETGDTATDSSGNENHGTLMPASPVWTTEGIIDGALDFNGTTDYVEVPDDPTLDITDEITLMAWVYPESWDSTYENGILTKAGDENYGVWNLHYKWEEIQHSGFRFEANIDGNTENIFEITPSEDLNRWYHVAGVYDGFEMKLFIDGELVNSKPVTGLISTNDQPLRFGKQFWWGSDYSMWDGMMDDIKIYSRALSDDEILNEFCQAKTTITINEPGPEYDEFQYGYFHDYSGANVEFTYCNKDSNLRGIIQASGLKPFCTYQVKLIGIPTCLDPSGDDLANEYIGYNGRWTCVDCGCTGAACNRNDGQYEANSPFRGSGSECIAGYLVFDFFTADENGDAYKFIEAETSYHVLRAGGGVCGASNDNYLEYLDTLNPSIYFCKPQYVNGEPEPDRGGCGGLNLDPDTYHSTIALTEESFHKGNWATVLEGEIDFEII